MEKLGKYLDLEEFCTCSQTYRKYQELIDPWPKNQETLTALKDLNQIILDPIIKNYGRENFVLTYGFCSPSLKRYLDQKDPLTGRKNGRVDATRDQHLSHELNKNGKYYCVRLGCAADFLIKNCPMNEVVEWILETKLPFDSLYFYGVHRPIHISYGPEHKRAIWTFTESGMPTKKGIEKWLVKEARD